MILKFNPSTMLRIDGERSRTIKIQNSCLAGRQAKFKINPKSKCQIPKQKFCHLKFVLCHYFVICALVFVIYPAYAKEITILYTGETHAMLYPCDCPKEPDGGIARRASKILELKKKNPNTLVLDSGGFFAGGLMDVYTQNTDLDKERTLINLRAIELMGYDALAIGDDEFNFGKEFLEKAVTNIKVPFLSCNIESDKLLPYLIKEIAGCKIGIIGVTNMSAMQKAGGLKFIEPKVAVKRAVEELRKNNTDIIILLSHLGENDDLNLIKDVEGIDILIAGHTRSKEEPSFKIGSTLILRPSWQGRHLGKMSFTMNPVRNTKALSKENKISNGVKDKKIIDYKVEELRLSDKISDDPIVLSILPRCFADTNCKKEGMEGICQYPGTLKSKCLFTEASKVNLLVITPKVCRVCDTEKLVGYLKTQFSGLTVSYLYYPDARANRMIKDFGIKALPVYLLGKEIAKDKGFDNLRENLEIKGDFYILKPQFSGIAYFLERENIKNRLDLFVSLFAKNAKELLEMIKEFSPNIHFLSMEQGDKFEAARGNAEVEENLRSVCVQKYYPQSFWDYLGCRVKNIESSWWEDCIVGLDKDKIKACAQGQEGKRLLKENTSLNKELQIMFGPTYLLDNQEVFSSQGVVSRVEFKRIIK